MAKVLGESEMDYLNCHELEYMSTLKLMVLEYIDT